MKFIDYLRTAITEEKEFDVIVGDRKIPEVYVTNKTMGFDNSYLHIKYGSLLNAEIEIVSLQMDTDELHVMDSTLDNLCEEFFLAVAGFVSGEEYEKLFLHTESTQDRGLNPICVNCLKLHMGCGGTTNPNWAMCICREEQNHKKFLERIADKYGEKAKTDVFMLLEAYLNGNISDTDVCKLYYRNRIVTFADAFKEAERVGVNEVVVYNRNPKYITDTPYFQKSMEDAKENSIYTSNEEIESFHFRIDEEEGSAIYIYFKRR